VRPDATAPAPSDASSLDSAPTDTQTSADGGVWPDAAAEDAPAQDAATEDAAVQDAGTQDGATYRNSLSVCWTDVACPRVFAINHGGEWALPAAPYLSNAAIAKAYQDGADGVKIDVRITMDGVPVLAHSSPIQIYESIDCFNKKIEEMTAAEVTMCHRAPSSTETFQRLDDVLNYLRGKMVAQLTVKLQTDYAGTIAAVINLGAQDFAFLEISTSDLETMIPSITGSTQVYYLISIGQLSEIDTLLNTIKNPRAFMFEMTPSSGIAMLVATRLHPAGIRSFTYDSSVTAPVSELQGLYTQGFDVVSSQAGTNGVQAREAVNQSHAVSPP
jgi:glycerophosphoryl diester phosphodiesterase